MTTTTNHFSFFEGTKTQHVEPKITVRRGGLMVLTQGAVDMLGDDVTHVQLGYDDATQAIAFRAAPEGAKGRYLLRQQKNGSTRLVDGKRFLKHNGLKVDQARSFDVETFGDGLIGFKLADEPAPAKPAKDASKDAGTSAEESSSLASKVTRRLAKKS